MKRLLVVDPSVAYPEDEGIATVLRGWPGESVIAQPGLRPGDGPASSTPYDVDGIVVMGSRASVHDDVPWLRDLGAWLDPILSGTVRIPLLGICFGHQLIAQRAGGIVGELANGAHELGVKESRFDGSRLVPGRTSLLVVASHGEEVKTVPDGYRVVAVRDRVPVDGIEHERLPIFGVQFHPEARESFLEARALDASALATAGADGDRLIAAFQRVVLET